MKFDIAELHENLSKHFDRATSTITLREDPYAFCVHLESNSPDIYWSKKRLKQDI
jgi:hypothetical protein